MNETPEHANPLRGSDSVVFFLFTCALSFLLFAPLLIVLVSYGTAAGYWAAGAVACIWLTVSAALTWDITAALRDTPRQEAGE